MDDPSVHALVCDLVGSDLDAEAEGPQRPTVRRALSRAEPGQVVAARRGSRKFCVVRLDDGRSFAVPDSCPHDGGLLSDGFIEGDRLVCARHGWEFDLETGACPMRSEIVLDVSRLQTKRRKKH